jgi:hypothetical protein
LEETLSSFRVCERALAASLIAFGLGFASIPTAWADEDDGNTPGVQVNVVDGDGDGTTAAPTACGEFAQALDASSDNYGDFADSFEGSDYSDPAVDSSNATGRAALRQASSIALQASGTPGLQPEIANPMRLWSVNAAALIVKMGLRIPGDSLNTSVASMNAQAEEVQKACAAAGTHA